MMGLPHHAYRESLLTAHEARKLKPNNVILVGLMGSGKTTVGKLLSRQFRWPFYDTDHEIVRRNGVSIPTIFELEGESGFRLREEQVVADLVKHSKIILATGGGVVLSPSNRAQLTQHGIVVYLRGTVEELWQRTRNDVNRPLLQVDDPKARLAELHAKRDPLYREIADVLVETGRQPAHVLAQQLGNHLQCMMR